MALQAGSVTIKTSGGTYSSWAAFWDDIGDLTGNITCTVDDTTFTEATAPAGVTESLGGYTITVTPATRATTTDATTGPRFECSYWGWWLGIYMTGGGNIIIDGIVVKGAGAFTPGGFGVFANVDVVLKNNIFKNTNTNIYFEYADIYIRVYNNIVIEAKDAFLAYYVLADSSIIANNTIVDCDRYGINANNKIVSYKNNLVYNSGTANFIKIGTGTSGYNNASSDTTGEDADWGGTGTDNVTGISDPFNALASDDFTITSGGVVGTAGYNYSGSFTDDFFGVTRDNWTIGACEYISPTYSVSVVGSRDIKYLY